MTVQELQSHAVFTARWTEACPVDHGLVGNRVSRNGVGSTDRPVVAPAGARMRPPTRSEDRRVGRAGTTDRIRPVADRRAGSVRSVGHAPVAPGRRVLARPAVGARACHVDAPSPAGVVDDVPTWALLACGILVGVLMLLALAFLGGPAYV